MKRKIAFILPSLNGGGAERVIVNIIRKLDQEKFDISLILFKKKGPYIDLLPSNIDVIDLETNRARKSVLCLLKSLNNIKPDIIFSTLGYINLIVISVRHLIKGKPKVIIREANTPSKNITRRKRVTSFLYRILYPKADLIISQCKEMKLDIINYLKIDPGKICYIYNPIDIEYIKKNSKGENPYEYNKVNLLSVGRLSAQKGFDILLKAFQIVSEEIPNVHLTILGEGDLKGDLQNLADFLEISRNVSFIGFKENPYPYYYYSDLYILSSRWEGFPNSLLEALACGTKVLSTDCKSGPREILENDKFGNIVKEGDYKELATGIINTIYEKNKSANRADSFDISNIIKDYETVLLQR